MYVEKAFNASPTSTYQPCYAKLAWGPTVCICDMNAWWWEVWWVAATWIDTCHMAMSPWGKKKSHILNKSKNKFSCCMPGLFYKKIGEQIGVSGHSLFWKYLGCSLPPWRFWWPSHAMFNARVPFCSSRHGTPPVPLKGTLFKLYWDFPIHHIGLVICFF